MRHSRVILSEHLPYILLGAYLAWMVGAISFLLPTGFHSSQMNYYALFAQSLRKGHLWVASGGPEACVYDSHYFKGKCYLYWGIVPALFHVVLPWISDRVFSILSSALAIFFLLRILMQASLRSIKPNASNRAFQMEPMVVLPTSIFLVFGTGLATTAFCGWIYGEAICFSHAFGLAAIERLLPFLMDGFRKNPSQDRFLSGGILLGLAALSRATWFLPMSSIAVIVVWHAWRNQNPESLRKLWKLFIPLMLAVCLQLYFNWAKFENPLEFGNGLYTWHLLGKRDFRTVHGLYTWKAIPFNFATYFIAGLPPLISGSTLSKIVPQLPKFSAYYQANFHSEFPTGLLILMPSLLLALPKFIKLPKLIRVRLLLLGFVFLPMSFGILMNASQVWRYQLEVWLTLLCILIPTLWCRSRKAGPFEVGLHWISSFIAAIITLSNTYWIVSTRLSQL